MKITSILIFLKNVFFFFFKGKTTFFRSLIEREAGGLGDK